MIKCMLAIVWENKLKSNSGKKSSCNEAKKKMKDLKMKSSHFLHFDLQNYCNCMESVCDFHDICFFI